jgi:hypothetical protein
MTATATASPGQVRLPSITARQFRGAVGLALLAVGLGCLIYAVETFVVGLRHRIVQNPSAAMMRACGLAHFWVGWLFLFTSPRLRNRRALGRLLAAGAAGAALCLLAAWGDMTRSPLTFVLFYGYFLVHEVLDEASLFRAYGDAPAGRPEDPAVLRDLSWAAALLMTATLAGGYLAYRGFAGREGTGPGVVAVLVGVATVCLAAGSRAAARFWALGRRTCGCGRALLTAYRPLLAVYGGLFLVLLAGVVAGSVVFNLIILIHAASWLLFVRWQLGRRPSPARPSLWAWLRGTPSGFVALHAAVLVLILVLLALRQYVWERSGLGCQLLAGSSFPYWSLMHISVAFWRPR